MATVCLDASFVIAMHTRDEFTQAANSLWYDWSVLETTIVAPPLILPEVTSVLRSHVYRGLLSPDEGEAAFRSFYNMPVEIVQDPGLHQRAWDLARRFNRPRAYDAFYVAVSQLEDCELWTADRRLVNSFGLPNIHWLGEAVTAC